MSLLTSENFQAFFSAFLSYYLIKFTPLWGLSLLATCVIYLGPLIYIQNQELIDAKLNQGHQIMSQQATQMRDMTGQYTGKAGEHFRNYAGQAQQQVSGLMGQAKSKAGYAPNAPATSSGPKASDFPTAPAAQPMPDAPKEAPPKYDQPAGSEPVAAS